MKNISGWLLRGATRPSVLAQIGQIVFHVPGFAAVRGALAQLTYFIGRKAEELEMPQQFRPVGLRNLVGPEIHHPVLNTAVEMDHAADVVNPELFPTLEICVVNVVALACVAAAQARPVLPNHAVAKLAVDMAGATWHCVGGGDNIPLSHPEVKLPIFDFVLTGSSVRLRLLGSSLPVCHYGD